jgi:serine protease AprX
MLRNYEIPAPYSTVATILILPSRIAILILAINYLENRITPMNHLAGNLTLCALLCTHAATSGTKIGSRLADQLPSRGSQNCYTVWVTFTDKGPEAFRKTSQPSSLVSERSLQRRRNVLPADDLVDETDLPLEQSYVEAVRASGASLRQHSRWFNAASIVANEEQIGRLALLPFVHEIELVGKYGNRRSEVPADGASLPPPPPAKTDGVHALDYGPSANQLLQIHVPAVHDLGNHAEGVIVGVFDNGFRLPSHEVFAAMNIIATHDFVDHKTSVVPNNTAPDFGDHGINTLSTIGGYKTGQLIGPAFGGSFILARTENDSSETPVEEDNWVAAIEWADSLGVQVTSTSLGYGNDPLHPYPPPYTSWTWEDMNGRTTLISRAAAMAVRKGIVVLNSAGNGGYNATRNTLNAPADADSVVAVGAVSLGGDRTSFSSIGPSTAIPPRIKPDVMALGTGVYIASASDPHGYSPYGQGTSFACPLAAGVAALLVKAAPTASPMDIVNAMKQTASRASTPDNLMGWGVINAKAALDRLTGTDTNVTPGVPVSYMLDQNFPNPFNPGTTIGFRVPNPAWVRLAVYDLLGREVALLVNEPFGVGYYRSSFIANGLSSGVYVYRLQETGGNASLVETRRMIVVR